MADGNSIEWKRNALNVIENLKSRVATLESRQNSPIAIIGMACRFPGAPDLESFWELLSEGREAITEVPRDRWNIDEFYDPDPDAAGRMYTRHGGFLDRVDTFDAALFGISPREARGIDPQQRIFLETVWQAVENAGRGALSLKRSRTGVFVGVGSNEYARILAASGLEHVDAWYGVGNALNVVAGRVAFCFGFEGPAISIDTACSSSLAALHQACQSLRSADCDMAVTGGVNLMLSPVTTIATCRAHMLAADGRCKTFDASADGYVRGEGCGVVVLKRLADAQRDGDRIAAVIRGSAVNQDGASSGLTVPSGPAQERVIADALAQAGIEGREVDYLEAHGTGTSLGDPIEVRAVAAVLGRGRDPKNPLLIGSVKTNIGHLEAASGIAGLIKTVLAMRAGVIPRHLHFQTPNPHIRWDDIPVQVTASAMAWPQRRERPLAGVSSFGFSGTNAHILLEGPPAPVNSQLLRPDRHILLLSAKTESVLTQIAMRYREWLKTHPATDIADVCYTAAVGRSHLETRAAYVVGSIEEAIAALEHPSSAVVRKYDHIVAWLFENSDLAAQSALARDWQARGLEPDVSFGPSPSHVFGVRNVDAVDDLVRRGVTLLLDFSQLGAAADDILRCWPEDTPIPAVVRMRDTQSAAASLYEAGISFDLRALQPGRIIDLPTYPFERERYWPEWASRQHPLNGTTHELAEDGKLLFVSEVGAETHPYLADHLIQGVQVMPATGFASMVISAIGAPCRLSEVLISEPLRLRTGEKRAVQLMLKPLGERQWSFEIHSQTVHEGWRLHSRGIVERLSSDVTAPCDKLPSHLPERDVAEFLGRSSQAGLALGPAFGGIKKLWSDGKEALAEIQTPAGLSSSDDMPVHPAVLDACSQVAGALISESDPDALFLPVRYGRLDLYRALPDRFYCRGNTVESDSPDKRIIELRILGQCGELLGQFNEFLLKRVERQAMHYQIVWREHPHKISEPINPSRWLVTGADDFAGELMKAGHQLVDDLADCDGIVAGSWNAALPLIQELIRRSVTPTRGLWLVTRGTWAVGGRPAVSPDGGILWGFGRTVQAEQPGLNCRLLDVDPEDDISLSVFDEPELQQAWRAGTCYVPRLVRAQQQPTQPVPIEPHATYLVTGAFGSIGRKIVQWLSSQGAQHVVQVGRIIPADCDSRYAVAADIADPDHVQRLHAHISTLPPLCGIFHAAGVLDDGVLSEQTPERFERVFRPKARGTWNLHEVFNDAPLDYFVLFSSVAAAFGSPGQSNYAAANGYLDALAEYRRSVGLPAISIHWGPWAEGGMASDRRALARLRREGLEPLTDSEGLNALGRLLHVNRAESTVIKAQWTRQTVRSPLIEELAPRARERKGSPLLDLLLALPEDKRAVELETQIAAAVQSVLALPGLPAPLEGFFNLGMDSLTSVELTNRVQDLVGDALALSSTAAFDYPTVRALSRHLSEKLLDTTSPSKSRPHTSRRAASAEPIAIVGVSGRFPKSADLDEFWELLVHGRDGIDEVPADRWDVDAYYDPDPDAPGKMTTRYGGFLRGIDEFDPGFFGISPREAESMDPQHRMLLEESWHALEDAAIAPSSLMGTQTGVFIGISTSDYTQLLSARGIETIDQYFGSGNSHSTAAGRLSYILGLEGPSFTVDTACSAALVALNQACKALQAGDCHIALTGGVNALLIPGTTVYFSKARMMSPDGRCKTFDAAADGYVRGEGCGVVVLKRLSDAERDGDRIWSIIRGSSVNQDGRSSGLTVPNGPAQERVIRDALAQSGLQPSEVSYVEAHGTGTALGDPIELTALQSVFGSDRDTSQPLLVGSVKTNIGHLEAAAGTAGLVKILLAMQHGKIPPHLHFHRPTPRIPWDRFSLRVVTQPCDWPRTRKIAGLSSFAFSGTNAHVILEAGPDSSPELAPATTVHQLILSARTQSALRRMARLYRNAIAGKPDSELADICFTAAVGRARFEHRALIQVTSIADACDLLDKLAAGESDARIATGNVEFSYPAEARRRRVALPGYPFERQRCWATSTAPLLPARQQLATGQRIFTNRLSVELQPWLADHRVFGEVVTPGAMYISMAVSANELPCRISHGVFTRAMQFPSAGSATRDVQLMFQPPDSHGRSCFQVYSKDGNSEGWISHAEGTYGHSTPSPQRHEAVVTILSRLVESSVEELFEFSASVGIELGPSFRGLRAVWQRDGEAIGEIEARLILDAAGLAVHPAVLDSALQVVGAAIRQRTDQAHVPFEWEELNFYRKVPPRFFCHASARPAGASDDTITADLWLITEAGEIIAEIEGYVAKRASRQAMLERGSHAVDGWLYTIEWREQPKLFWPSPAEIACTVRRETPDVGVELVAGYRRLLAVLESRSRSYIERALASIGNKPILPRFDRLLARLRQVVASQGPYISNNDFLTTVGVERALLDRCGSALADVLLGAADPLSLLFPVEGISAEDLYHNSPQADLFNNLVRRSVETALKSLPASRTLHVLEIGAGTGGTTASVLPALPANRSEFVYTDISGGFFSAAEDRFAKFGFVEYRTLDIERNPTDQGFEPHCYDIVLAANVLHATRDIEATLAHVRQLLAPGGLLIVLEGLARQAWVDLTFGLLDGWWRFDDAVRKDYPLLDREGWSGVLSKQGFDSAEAISPEGIPEQAVIVARACKDVPATQTPSITSDCEKAFAVIQDSAQRDETPANGMTFVTQGSSPNKSPVWGLVKSARLELPELRCRIVDFSADDIPPETLQVELAGAADEDFVTYREGRRFVPRLVRQSVSTLRRDLIRFDPEAGYLITGGTGGLGLQLARWMIDHGARRLWLNARHGPSQEAAAAIDQLRQHGAFIEFVQGDIAIEKDARRVLGHIKGRLDGIFHLAGLLHDASIVNQTWPEFANVLAPKVDGSWNLHHLTADSQLSWFVLFSSTASVLGNAGQANHAAANSFLDALAHHRREKGQPAISINWAAWSETGSAAKKNIASKLKELGMDWIPPQLGIEALEAALLSGLTQQVIAPIRWDVFRRNLSGRTIPPLLRELIVAPVARVRTHSNGLVQWLEQSAAGSHRAIITDYVASEVRQVLRLSDPPDPATGFFDLGMDSLMAVELRNRLNRELQLASPLSSTVLFDHPSTGALAEYLTDRLSVSATTTAVSAEEDLPDMGAEALSELLAGKLAEVLSAEER